ncbi:MAG: hypothetical protein AVO33_11295 [delta proteobacterium ML8_F1]|nr:MAG: hypothetical protein AVO33_11295 [delta proteobacterium ML8_F1]
MGLSQRNIAYGCSGSKTTVNRVIKRADELGITWPFNDNQTDGVLAEKLFPVSKKERTQEKRPPDFSYLSIVRKIVL